MKIKNAERSYKYGRVQASNEESLFEEFLIVLQSLSKYMS